MGNRRHYYRILHVQPDAPLEVIKSSYRTLMTKLRQHPDLGGDDANASLLNEAYAVLTDPAKREAYDRELLPRVSKSHLSGFRGADVDAGADSPPMVRSCPFCRATRDLRLEFKRDTRCHRCAGPLYPADKLDDAGSDQRALLRMPRTGQIQVFTCWPQQSIPAYARDLSPAGIQFVFELELNREQIIKIEDPFVHAIARVANCRRLKGRIEPSFAISAAFLTRLFDRAQGTFLSTSV